MISKLDLFRRYGKKNGFEPLDDTTVTSEQIQEDRKLVHDILPATKKIITKLNTMEVNNSSIVELKRKQAQAPYSDNTEQSFSEDNRKCQKFIKEALDQMKQDVATAKNEFANEPE